MANALETAKKAYNEPRIIDYGKVADLTKKPGTRSDGSVGTKGDRGIGS
jgi:hypothetical protein